MRLVFAALKAYSCWTSVIVSHGTESIGRRCKLISMLHTVMVRIQRAVDIDTIDAQSTDAVDGVRLESSAIISM